MAPFGNHFHDFTAGPAQMPTSFLITQQWSNCLVMLLFIQAKAREESVLRVERRGGERKLKTVMVGSEYDSPSADFKSGLWNKDMCQTPLLTSLFKKFAEEHGSAPWKAVDVGCGIGPHTLDLLKAGASTVLAMDKSKNMVEEAKTEIAKFLHSNVEIRGRVEFAVVSATECSSIPEVQEGDFDLVICIYVLCALLSKEEVKRAIAEIFKVLKPGGKLVIFEAHVIQYMEWDDKATRAVRDIWTTPKKDGTRYSYFEDEGTPQEVNLKVNSGGEIKLIDRFYTLSSWVSFIQEVGFQVTQLHEPYIDPKVIPADAPDYMKFAVGKPMGMCWECTKPLSQRSM